MKIAFIDFFQQGNNAEEEITKRLKYCFEKQGDSFFIVDKFGFFIDSSEYKGKHVDETDIDFVYTFNHSETTPILPNKYSVFFHWSPSGFLPPWLVKKYISNLFCFDDVFGGYETKDAYYDCLNAGMKDASLVHIGSSVPKDFCLLPQRLKERKLFYCGINLEAKTSNQRFGKLFKYLDRENKINFYGPRSVFGIKDCWEGYKNYKGEIPFDGKSIIEKISETGIVLALNSPVHSAVGSVSNRIYEAAAAGAVIISDDNPYVRKYFGDSVFYIDIYKEEDELSNDILNIVDFINENPEKSYKKATDAQKLFFRYLSLDDMVEQAKIGFSRRNRHNDNDVVDVISFVEKKEDFLRLYDMLKMQSYKNLNQIFICSEALFSELHNDFQCVVSGNISKKGEALDKIREKLKGEYIIFFDKYSDIQNRYIEKMVSRIKDTNTNFAYSGCYQRKFNSYRYDIVNDSPILNTDFLSFFGDDIEKFFLVEKKLPKQCCLFSKKLFQYAERIEQISDAIHLYLAALSIIKFQDVGTFVPVLQSGYILKNNDTIDSILHSKMYTRYVRCHGTAFKELCGALLQYDFCLKMDKTTIEVKNIKNIHNKTKKIIEKCPINIFLLIKKFKRKIPDIKDEKRLDEYLGKRKFLRNILYFLAKLNEKGKIK